MIELEQRGVTPHAAMRGGPVGGEKQTMRRWKRKQPLIAARQRMAERLAQADYALSQGARKRIEEAFGWCKTIGGLARSRHVGRWKITQQMELAAAAFNLIRMRKLLA